VPAKKPNVIDLKVIRCIAGRSWLFGRRFRSSTNDFLDIGEICENIFRQIQVSVTDTHNFNHVTVWRDAPKNIFKFVSEVGVN
jgi:hypothetical protein